MRSINSLQFAVVFLLQLMLMTSLTGSAQEYNYKRYDSRDGLANPSVYQMLQDKDGFLWFATGGGLSRFDGTHFKNFTMLDGLPANTIVRMFEDSRGRLWLAPFANAICFYYKGKIHTQKNDSLLAKMKLVDFVRDVIETKDRELLLTDSRKVYRIDANDSVTRIGQELSENGLAAFLGATESGELNFRFGDKLFTRDRKAFRYLREVPRPNIPMDHLIVRDKISCWMEMNTLYVESPYYKKFYKQVIGSVNTMRLLNDSILCLNTTRGTWFFNLLQQKTERRFLPNGNVSGFIVDKEGGHWFSTLDDGVFRLSSPAFKSIVGRTDAGQKLTIYSLAKFKDEIWAGSDMGHVMKIKNDTAIVMTLAVGGEVLGRHPVTSIVARNNRLAAACGNYVFIKGQSDRFSYRMGSGGNKGVVWRNNNELLTASTEGLYSMPVEGTGIDKYHYIGRTTCVYHRNDSIWFGTFDGLYLVKPQGDVVFLGKDDSLLRVPVASIREGLDGTIWIATSGRGLIGLQNNKIVWHFNTQNGLNSDKVRCIGIDSGSVWAATEKELNKILLQPHPVITRYAYSGELNSDVVNALLVDKNIVYAGTPDGVTWFDKRDSLSASRCNLKMMGVTVNEEEKEFQNSYSLPYKNNNIRFEYVAISMKSAGSMTYRYRVNGLDTNWRSTTQTSLELISLPPGEYKLELFAINKFDVKSSSYSVKITVQNPFWRTAWFMVCVMLLTAAITWFFGTRHNRAVARRTRLRRIAEQQLLDLEQKALRAQMNPHFIFNCLHSIQNFILDKDPEKANKYLTQFARLIRQTLENSFQSSISLSDEIKYLATYLQLEQMRSESAFTYRIETDADLLPAAVSIPVMVIQPFVENAVRHGVQGIHGRNGLIGIYFSINGQELVCRVEDNGIGRQQAAQQKNVGPPLHRSRGLQLTYERIELINANSVSRITVEILDKFDDANAPVGTDVIIRFPNFTGKDNTLS